MMKSKLLASIQNVDTYMGQTREICERIGDRELADALDSYDASMTHFCNIPDLYMTM